MRVAQRNPRQAYFIQPLGQVGQFGFVQADITNARQRRATRSTARPRWSTCAACSARRCSAVHVDGARNVAEAARDAGADSAGPRLGDRRRPAVAVRLRPHQGRRRGGGAQGAFPGATIIRPSLVFGPEDDLTNRFAGMARLPFLPVIAAKRNFQPVYVRDLGQGDRAWRRSIRSSYGGKTYEIGGPQVMSMVELHQRDPRAHRPDAGARRRCPTSFGDLLSRFGWLPGAPLTRDQWLMLQRDNVPSRRARRGSKRSASSRRRSPRSATNGSAASTGRQVRRPPNQFDRDQLSPTLAHANPADRDHPRHRRGRHRIPAGLLDRPFDPRHRAARLRRRASGRRSTSSSSSARSSRSSCSTGGPSGRCSKGCSRASPMSWRFVRNILVAFLPSAILGFLLINRIEALLGNADGRRRRAASSAASRSW